MSFYGAGTLSGYQPEPPGGLDPQLYKALTAAFPGLQGLSQPQGQQGAPGLSQMGYAWPGTQFSAGQGQNSFANLSPFESAGASNPESITGGLASGTFGKSSSQQPTGGGGGINALSLPQLQLPMAQVASQQASINGDEGGMGMAAAGAPSAGGGIVNTALGGANKALDLLGGSLGTQTTTPGYAEQRAGERTDYSNATGSPGGIPQLGLPTNRPTLPSNAPLPSLSDIFGGMNGSTPSPTLGAPGLNPASTVPQGIMPGTSDVLGGVNAGETSLAAPGGSAQFALGNGAPTDWGGVAQGGLGALGGLFNLFQGAEQGNVGGIGAGGLQTIGGLTSILQNSPGLAASLGLDASGAALSGVGGAAGGIGGLYSLYQGIQSGDPVQMASGLLSAYQGGASLVGAITGETAPGILTGLATLAPETSAAIASALTGTEVAATAGAEAIAGTISAAAGAFALPVAAVIQAVMDTIAEGERQRVQNAGFYNNPIKGALYSASTQGVGSAQSALDTLTKQAGAGGLGGLSTFDIANTLGGSLNNLMPYYDTAQGGRGAIRASDTITGAGPDWSAKPWGGGLTPDQYTANFTKAQGGVSDLVNELLKRGVTYEQLGQMPGVSPDWTQQSLDMSDPLNQYYQRGAAQYDVEGNALLGRLGLTSTPITQYQSSGEGGMEVPTGQMQQWLSGIPLQRGLTAQDVFRGAQGSAALGKDKDTHAADLINAMYGGPLWTAMARMGVGGQDMQNLIQQHFDPWVNARTATGNQLSQMVTPILQGEMYQQTGQGGTPGAAPTAYYNQLPASGNNASGLPTRGAPSTFWSDMINQHAGQDQTVQALQQYMQQLSQLQGQLPQINQAAGQMSTTGLDPALLAAMQGAPGFSGGNGAFNPGGNGGGIDLQALLKQLGYAA